MLIIIIIIINNNNNDNEISHLVYKTIPHFLHQNKDGQPLLLVAAEAGLDNIVAALLVAGADPNAVHTVCLLNRYLVCSVGILFVLVNIIKSIPS